MDESDEELREVSMYHWGRERTLYNKKQAYPYIRYMSRNFIFIVALKSSKIWSDE